MIVGVHLHFPIQNDYIFIGQIPINYSMLDPHVSWLNLCHELLH